MMEMNTEAKIKMWKEDLGWLLEQPRTLERDHVAEVLKHDIQTFEDTIAANDSAYVRRLNRELIEQAAKIAELEQSATKLEEVLSVVRSSLMEHGDCKSHLRYSNGLPMACTACMARIKLSEMVSEWKGPTVKLAAAFAAKEE